jgi:hypothetical protein
MRTSINYVRNNIYKQTISRMQTVELRNIETLGFVDYSREILIYLSECLTR